LEVLTVVQGTDPDATFRRRRMGAAIRRHRANRSQADLAAVLGVSQAGISLWESGGVDFTYEQVHAIEAALGLPHGLLGRIAGYVKASDSIGPMTVPVDTVDDVIDAVRAASVFGLHVAIANRFDTNGSSEEWLVVVGGDDDPDNSL
jgi:transcriptional regulator with XRE-family HTH domain